MVLKIHCTGCRKNKNKRELTYCGHGMYSGVELLFFECKHCRGCITLQAEQFSQFRKKIGDVVIFEIPEVGSRVAQ